MSGSLAWVEDLEEQQAPAKSLPIPLGKPLSSQSRATKAFTFNGRVVIRPSRTAQVDPHEVSIHLQRDTG